MTTLKNVLLINAISSGATGFLLLEFPGFIANLFGVSQTMPFVATGIFLIAFALLVYFASRQNPVNKALVRFISILDIVWVVESLIIVLPQLFGLTFMGYFLITAVAAWVGMMAYLQFRGLKATFMFKPQS